MQIVIALSFSFFALYEMITLQEWKLMLSRVRGCIRNGIPGMNYVGLQAQIAFILEFRETMKSNPISRLDSFIFKSHYWNSLIDLFVFF